MTKPIVMIQLAAIAGLLLFDAGDAAAQGQGGSGMQQRIEMIDTDGDGMIQRAELAAWRETVFLAMDSDGDGALTLDEYKAVQLGRGADPEARGPRYAQMQEAKAAAFVIMDANGDGLVPLDDFLAHAEAAFIEADTDADGALTAAEFGGMHRRP